MDAQLNEGVSSSLQSPFGRNSFSLSGGFSFGKLVKLIFYILFIPFYLLVLIYVVLWPLGALLTGWQLFSQVWPMVRDHQVETARFPVIAEQLFILWFILRIPTFVRQALWVKIIDTFTMCCTPGKMLQIVQTSPTTSDVIFDESFITSRRGSRALRVIGSQHVRRSLDMSIADALMGGAYGPIGGDDVTSPKYFLSGTGDASIEGYDELWTTHASVSSWAALYSWCGSLRLGRTSIPLDGDTTVLGYVHLLETSEPISPDRITTRFAPCMGSSPCFMREDQVIARRWYWVTNSFGNFKYGVPDAFVFRKGSIRELGLQTVHTFRLCAHDGHTEA